MKEKLGNKSSVKKQGSVSGGHWQWEYQYFHCLLLYIQFWQNRIMEKEKN